MTDLTTTTPEIKYCRINRPGSTQNGRVGIIIDRPEDFGYHLGCGGGSDRGGGGGCSSNDTSSSAVVVVRFDGEKNMEVVNNSNQVMTVMKSSEVQNIFVSWGFDSNEPYKAKFAIYEKSSTYEVDGHHENTTKTVLFSGCVRSEPMQFSVLSAILKMFFENVLIKTTTILHIPDLNFAIALNKYIIGDEQFTSLCGRIHQRSVKDAHKMMLEIAERLSKNYSFTTMVKWTPEEDICIKDRQVDQHETFDPKTLGLFHRHSKIPKDLIHPTPFGDMDNTLNSIFTGIFHIFPNRDVKGCYDVMYALDGEHQIGMVSFMASGLSEIGEWHDVGKLFNILSPDLFNSQNILNVNPLLFWNILFQLEKFYDITGFPPAILTPLRGVTPAKNRQLLAKRTIGMEEESGFLDFSYVWSYAYLPEKRNKVPAPFDSAEEQQLYSDRHARLGALMLLTELGRRTSRDLILASIPSHLEGTEVIRDIEKALTYVNDNRQYEMVTRILQGGYRCAYCGKVEMKDKPPKCGKCGTIYCNRTCQENDFRHKHRKICKHLKEERDGVMVLDELTFDAYAMILNDLHLDAYGLQNQGSLDAEMVASADRINGYRA